MARQTAPQEISEGKYWKPQSVGEEREGVYIRSEPPEAGKEKFGLQYVLRSPKGQEVVLPSHESLKAMMAKRRVGEYIWVKYLGKKGKAYSYNLDFDPDHKPEPPGEQTRIPTDPGSPEKAILDELKGASGFFADGIIPESNTVQCISKHVNGDILATEGTLKRLKDRGAIFWIENTTVKGYRVSA